MPIILPKKRSMPERIKRHIALRDLAQAQAADQGRSKRRRRVM
jgi:hypothetical protein